MSKEKTKIKAITKTVPAKHRMLTIRLSAEDHTLFKVFAAETGEDMQGIASYLIAGYLTKQKILRDKRIKKGGKNDS